jgi:hypothetical protein
VHRDRDTSLLRRPLLDAKIVDVPMTYSPTLVMRSSLKSLCFNSLTNESRFSDTVGTSDPGIQYERPGQSVLHGGRGEAPW